jgi:hypothetical protein
MKKSFRLFHELKQPKTNFALVNWMCNQKTEKL